MPANKKHDEPLSDAEVAEIEKRIDSFPLSPLQARALCATVRALRERLADAKRWQMSVEEREAAVCPEDVGFDEHIRWYQSQMQKVTNERDNLLNRSHQTVVFKCGCVFKQKGLDAEPLLITHCITTEPAAHQSEQLK